MPDNHNLAKTEAKHLQTAQRKLAGRGAIAKRRDHQPLPRGATAEHALTTPSPSRNNQERLFLYRDRCMAQLRPLVPFDLMLRLDERSQQCLFSDPFNTEKARYSDLLAWAHFCADHQFQALPAIDHQLERYLDHLVSLQRARGTIDRHIASMLWWHRLLGLDDPAATFIVSTRLKRARRETKPPEQAEGLRFAHLKKALEVFQPDILRDCADIALLFTAFDTLCRRSELVAANWSDIAPDPEDGSGLLYIALSKTDQQGEGHWVYLSATTMRVLDHWQRCCGVTSGAIFRGIDSANRLNERLSDKGVDRAFKRIARTLGFSARLFSGHSTRVGAAQEMVEANIDTAGILLAGRWKDSRMVTRYAKKASAKNSGAALLAKKLGTNVPANLPMLPGVPNVDNALETDH